MSPLRSFCALVSPLAVAEDELELSGWPVAGLVTVARTGGSASGTGLLVQSGTRVQPSASSREEARALRVDAARSESLHQRLAHAAVVIGLQIGTDGDKRPQEIAKGDVDRRAIVERARAKLEEFVGGLACRLGQQVGERGRKLGWIDLAASGAIDPKQIRRCAQVRGEVRVEHRRDEDRAAKVRVVDTGAHSGRIGAAGPAPSASPRPMPEASPNCCASSISGLRALASPADLAGDVPLSVAARSAVDRRGIRPKLELVEATAGLSDRVEQRFLVREVQEQRRQIGERLVEREHVGVRWLGEEGPDPVDDRVRDLVRDDVVRQASEDALAGQVVALIGIRSPEIAEQDAVGLAAVERVGLDHRVRKQLEDPDVVRLARRPPRFIDVAGRTVGAAPMDRFDRARPRTSRASRRPPRRPSAGGIADRTRTGRVRLAPGCDSH